MVVRPASNRNRALAGGIALSALALFVVAASTTLAEGGSATAGSSSGLWNRVRSGVRVLTGGVQDPAGSGAIVEAKSARVLEREADERARNPHLVQVGTVAFDPRKGIQLPEGLPAELAAAARALPPSLAAAPDSVDYWIVQYDGAASEMRSAIDDIKADIISFIPNNAYMVRLDDVQLRQIQVAPMVRWVGRVLPGFKLDGPVLGMLAPARAGNLPLDPVGLVRIGVTLQPFITPEQYDAYVQFSKGMPGVELLTAEPEGLGFGSTLLLGINPSAFRDTIIQLASLRDVGAVWSAEVPKPHNDHAVWFTQGGNDAVQASDYAISAPLFRRGITGRGMIGSVADDGLENDMCQFRYTGAKNDAAWVAGRSSSQGGGGSAAVPDEQFLDLAAATPAERTRDRKVVAYYVMQGAVAYSSDIQHGTSVSGCMLGDNNTVLASRPLLRDVGERQNIRPWRPTGTWTPGQELRPDVDAQVDKVTDPSLPGADDPRFPNTYGSAIEHHQARDGMAPGAQLVFQDIGNATGQLSYTTTLQSMLNQASRTGASVHNSSFGSAPCYDCYLGPASNADFQLWARRDLVAFVSAGNEGSLGARSIGGGHAHGKSSIAVGWSDRANSNSCPTAPSCPIPTTRLGHSINASSSKGPKSGGAIAPEFVTPGTVVTVAETGNPPVNPEDGTGTSDGGCGPSNPGAIGGTSFASPVAGGLALLVQQYFWDGYYPSGKPTAADAMRPTNALVRAVMVNSARNMEGARTNDTGNGQASRPNFGQGWGSPRLDDTLFFEGDPKRGNVEFETERARLVVLNDTPNGFDGSVPLVPEPGGATRDRILANFRPALSDRNIHEFFLNVVNDTNGDGLPDPDDKANELRITLSWSDINGNSNSAPLVNNLDLEVVSPGPNGVLETTGGTVLGDDVVYRPRPSTSWANGFTNASASSSITNTGNITVPFADTDLLNTVENVFIRSQDVVAGTYLMRVVARSVPGTAGTNGGYPNFALNDQAQTRDTDGDGTPDEDEFDTIFADRQGYALVVSGNFTTDQGLLSINKSNFGCLGEELTLTLNDQNGGSSDPGCSGTLNAVIKTTTPGPSFPADREVALFVGTQPTYRSLNRVTGANGFEVRLVRDPRDVVHGDGIIQVAHGETIIAEYTDQAPCGGKAFAQAIISCQPSVSDQGFLIADGCDYAAPGDPSSGPRPDGFMDAGELNRYEVFVANTGSTDLHDAIISLYPDPANAEASKVVVLDSPRYIGLMPPGRIADATFLVQVDPAMPPQWQMDFIVEVVSPRDGLLFPASFRQTQIFEADVVSFRYDTRDPNGELFKKGRIEVLKPGVQEIPGGNPDADYITNEPMWWDPDANNPADCDIPRNMWPDPLVPPLACTQNSNPTNPWDFDDSNDGWFEAAYDGDQVRVGIDTPFQWHWKAAPGGGGCGWENELHNQLTAGTDPLPAGHPDRVAQPWGIWHTGAINQSTSGPYAGQMTNNQGVPFFDNPPSPNDHTIMWDPPPAGGADNNTTGQWCNTYHSDPSQGTFYRSMLLAPRLYRVHQANPLYRVEFQSFGAYMRLDAHTIDGGNLAALGWFIHNQPVEPSSVTPLAYTWNQFQYYTNIFSDKVREDWSVDDNFLGDNISRPNEDFAYLTYEDIFGPAADSWNVAYGWTHIHFDGRPASNRPYGGGIDDVSFVWTESRDDADQSDCALVAGGQRPIVWFGENRYNACEGTLRINLWAPNETRTVVAVAVSSAAEDVEFAILTRNPATGRFEGTMAFTSDPRNNALGVLLVSAGSVDIGSGADQIRVEYDPMEADPAIPAAERADWCDADGNGINDDLDGDGVPDCEDDPLSQREVRDFSVINCTSGRLFLIKHELQQVGPGDGDRFADPGETQRMKVFLISALGADLNDVSVRVSTNDPICLIQDTVTMATLPGNATTVDTGFGFEFAVPQGMQTTDLANPRTVTFRVDVRGRNAVNLNEFSTVGESFNTFLPLTTRLLVDVDQRATNPDHVDTVPGRPTTPPAGTWFEGFNADPLTNLGMDHLIAPNFQPGWRDPVTSAYQDTTSDTRFGMAGNSGFCPECDVQDDCSVTAGNCEYYFSLNPTFQPGYDLSLEPPWNPTQAWAHEGTGSYKFGKANAGPGVSDQHYPKGVYASMQMPPLRIASTATNPELSFWHIANMWQPNFTSGLSTPIDGFVVEISASAVGVGDSGSGDDRVNRSQPARIASTYPLSSFQRLSPYTGLYDWETDALNACRALFCRYKHPVFSAQGDPITVPASATDPERGVPGTPGTWKESKIDLSDYRGMEVVIQFSAEVLQDLEVQNGSMGWFIDQVQVTGVSNRMGLSIQTANLTTEPCSITAGFTAPDPSCFGSDVQFLDRHTGVGSFDPGTGLPYPLEFEWVIGALRLRGFAGAVIPAGTAGVWGTYDNPRINLRTSAAAVGSPGRVSVTQNIYQNGAQVGSVTRDIVYKDAPVPVMLPVTAAYVGGLTQFTGTATFNTTLDPTRTLYWEWDFGDGTGTDGSGPSVQHVYAAPGPYTVTLRVYDEEGCVGTTTQRITVTAAPTFGRPTITPAADPDCGTPFGNDNNADIEELITVNVTFQNTSATANATGVIGYLTSPDDLVEIITGTADFGDVNATMTSGQRAFRFIRHDDGSGLAPACLVVPLQLTLVSNGGAIVQVLDLSFTMGNATNVMFDNAGTQSANFCRTTAGDGNVAVAYTGVAGGCANGLALRLDLRGTAQGVISDLRVEIESPDFQRHTVLYPGEGPNANGPYTIDFAFGASNGFGPIPDLNGQLQDTAGNLSDAVKATLVSRLVGTGMGGQWRVIVSSARVGTCGSEYFVTVREFQLEGSNSADLQVGNPVNCTSCLAGGSAPVFAGARAVCPNRVVFSPASDTYICNGTPDVSYELWASTTPGQLGTRIDGTARELDPAVTDCSDAACADGRCAYQSPPDSTFWDVCETQTVYWTVIAVDQNGTGPRTPNINTSTANPGAYQTASVDCTQPIVAGVFALVKSAGGSSGTLTAWLVPPVTPTGVPTWSSIRPPANADTYRILRGTFPTPLAVLGSRPAPYNHTGSVCSFATTSRAITADLTAPGSFYYLVPGVNNAGCAGMGYDSENSPIPGTGTGCPTFPDCTSP